MTQINFKDQYFKKAKRWAKILSHIPGIEAIFLSGSLAQGKAHQNSDIDFFILATPGKIWTTRFLVFLMLKLSANLAKPSNHKGRICPNHFITTDNLKIQDKNAYSANLFSHNQPLYDPENYFRSFALANSWVSDFAEAFPVQVISGEAIFNYETSECLVIKMSLLEQFFRKIQLAKIERNPDFLKSEAKIVLTERELRFHPHPQSRHWSKGKQEIKMELDIHNPYI